jgi:hypothetical protein
MAEKSRMGEDLVTVIERCDDRMARLLLCGVAGLSARVVGGMRVCARRFSPGVGVGGPMMLRTGTSYAPGCLV